MLIEFNDENPTNGSFLWCLGYPSLLGVGGIHILPLVFYQVSTKFTCIKPSNERAPQATCAVWYK